MSVKSDPRKSGTNTKGLGNSGNTKSSGSPKSPQPAKAGEKAWQAHDIKSLVQNHGRAKLGGQEWALKAPSWNDSALQAIISDPKFTAKPTGKSAVDGKLTYELRGHGKIINVTIGR